MQGKRNHKYETLNNSTISEIKWSKLAFKKPYYFFVPKDFELIKNYEKGFKVNEILSLNSNGIETKCDALAIQFSKQKLQNVINDFENETVEFLKTRYKEKQDSSGWTFARAKESILNDTFKQVKINYRPFDVRETIITKKSGGFIGRSRFEVMQHLLQPNIGLIIPRQTTQDYRHNFITDKIIEGNFTACAKLFGTGCLFPLYLYPKSNGQLTTEQTTERKPNINQEIVKEIAETLDLTFTDEKKTTENTFAPIDILDFIYAVLHSPSYRETYNEFLKIDFPRVPYPKHKDTFWQLVKLGGEIRQIHLLQSPKVEDFITSYPKDGNNVITTKVAKKDWELFDKEKELGRIWINDEQYFDNIPLTAWEFYIGGYQPAQKWLKDRKERTLEFDDILHYQKIIVALSETDRIMKEVDKIEIL